jgi:shikimate kinase
MTRPTPPRRILLVGFMASGKSAVGKALARELGWRFLDFDREVARREGRSIPPSSAERAKRTFGPGRRRWAGNSWPKTTWFSPAGGGWPCHPGRLDALPDGTLSIWIRVRTDTIVERASRRKGARPLLDVENPEARILELLKEREPWYRKADWTLSGDHGSPAQLARRIARRLRAD